MNEHDPLDARSAGPAGDWAESHRCEDFLSRARRICLLSYHSCPLAAPGGKQTGGMNVYVRELARQLGRRGYIVDAYTRSESAAIPHIPDTDLGPNVRVIHVVAGPEEPVSRGDIWASAPIFVDGVLELMDRENIRYDLYHSHYWMSGWAAVEIARRRPAPIVHMFHTLGAMKDLARGDGAPPELGARREVEHRLMRDVDRIVAATDVDAGHMVEHYGADPGKIAIIPPGVDLERFRPMDRAEALARTGYDPCDRLLLFVGRMDPVKGLDTLLRAMHEVVRREPAMLEHACLCVVGGQKPEDEAAVDAEIEHIHALRRQLGLGDFVRFVGMLSQDDLPHWYNAAEVVIVPSRYESFGMVALEAMACGTPVIATDVGGLATLVRDGRTGFLVPDGDPIALANKLLPLLALPEIHDTLGEHGMATAEAYGWPSIAERVEALYEDVLASHVRRRPLEAEREPAIALRAEGGES